MKTVTVFLLGYMAGVLTVVVVLLVVAVILTLRGRAGFRDRQAVTKVDVASILSEMDGGEEGNGKIQG